MGSANYVSPKLARSTTLRELEWLALFDKKAYVILTKRKLLNAMKSRCKNNRLTLGSGQRMKVVPVM